jgi:hypothetical protein
MQYMQVIPKLMLTINALPTRCPYVADVILVRSLNVALLGGILEAN